MGKLRRKGAAGVPNHKISVIPAEAGIQKRLKTKRFLATMDTCLRRYDVERAGLRLFQQAPITTIQTPQLKFQSPLEIKQTMTIFLFRVMAVDKARNVKECYAVLMKQRGVSFIFVCYQKDDF